MGGIPGSSTSIDALITAMNFLIKSIHTDSQCGKAHVLGWGWNTKRPVITGAMQQHFWGASPGQVAVASDATMLLFGQRSFAYTGDEILRLHTSLVQRLSRAWYDNCNRTWKWLSTWPSVVSYPTVGMSMKNMTVDIRYWAGSTRSNTSMLWWVRGGTSRETRLWHCFFPKFPILFLLCPCWFFIMPECLVWYILR